LDGILHWVRTHDESWLFVAIYIGFAVVLSVWLSLFWLVLMVGIHFLLEIFRQARDHEVWPAVLSMASWEIRVDLALLLLAFAVSLYMDLIMAILGLQSLGRAAVATSRVGARAVAWQRAVRAVVLGFDDVANAIRAIFMKKGGASVEAARAGAGGDARAMPPSGPAEAAPEVVSSGDPETETADTSDARRSTVPGWGDRWGFWDRFTMALSAACVIAMVAAPPLTDSTYAQAVETLIEELRPFPPPDEVDAGTPGNPP